MLPERENTQWKSNKKVGHEEGWTFELILTAGYQRVLSTCDNDAVLSLPAAFIATTSMSTALGLA